jgi:hypothetical protein
VETNSGENTMPVTNISELLKECGEITDRNISAGNELVQRLERMTRTVQAWKSLYHTKAAMYDALERKLFRVQAENTHLRAENDRLVDELYYRGGE